MPEPSVLDARRAFVVVGLVLVLGLAGCVGQDEAADAANTNATTADPQPATNRTDGGSGDPQEATPSNASTTNRADANTSLSGDLVWATNPALVRWHHENSSRTLIDLSDITGPDGAISAIAWGPEGDLFATVRPPFGPQLVSASPTGTPAVVQVDLGSGETEMLHSGTPLRSPVTLTVLDDGRVLAGDRGEIGGTPDPAVNAAGRVVEVSPDGQAGVLAADPRFDGWMDLHTVDGTVYLATQTDQRLLAPSAGNGTGALWILDPDTGDHELASASPTFQGPSGIAAGDEGLFLTEWSGQRLLQVDPSSGEAGVTSPVQASGNLWGLDRLPDSRLVASGVGGVWLVDPDTGDSTRLVETGSASPRHVRALEAG